MAAAPGPARRRDAGPSAAATDAETRYEEQFRAYRKEYLQYVNHKYFSGGVLDKTGPVYEGTSIVDTFIIKESRDLPLQTFLGLPRQSANDREDEQRLGSGTLAPHS